MVRETEADHIESVADGIRRAGAACRNHVARSVQIEVKGNLAGNRPEGRARNIISADFAQLIIEIEAILLFSEIRCAAAAAEYHAPGLFFLQAERLRRQARKLQSLLGCGNGERNGPSHALQFVGGQDRKSTRLNSSHVAISYAVFCLKK